MLNDLLKEYRELEEAVRPISARMRDIKGSIRDEMVARKLAKCAGDGVTASRYSTTKTTYPKSLIEEYLSSKQIALVSKTVTSEGLRITIDKG